MSRLTVFFVVTLMLALLVISPVGARDEKDKSDYSKEAYILEKLIVTHRYEKDGTGVREYHVRVKIQNEGAIETFGQLVFNFSGDNEKLEIENVTVTKPNGEKITATASNIQEVGAPVFGEAKIYTDLKQKHVTVPGLRPGDILEYRIAWKVTSPIIQNNFWIEHQFLDKDRIVLDEQLEINIPRDVYVKLKTEKDFDPIIKEEGDRKIYQWKRANLTIPEKKKDGEEEEKKDEKSDDDDDVGPKPPHVQLTTFKTWEEVGKWYSDLVRDRLQPDEKVRAKALELTKNLKTDQEKIETLYKFAAQNFRYVSLSLGQGRYQPHAASAVLTNQYGDCKDKHTLLTALLKSIGINADTVLINAERKLDPELPSPGQFNHVITAINYGSAKWWVDTTAEVAPFRLLNPGLRKKQALLVPETAPARLETTPTGLPFNAIENIEFKGAIDNLGEIKMSANLSLRGDPEMPYRLMFRRVPKDDQEKLGSVLTYNMGYGFDFSDIKFSDPGEVEKPYNLQFTMKKAAFLDRSEKKQQLEPPLSTFNVPSIVEKKKRTKPVDIGEPVETNYKSRIDIPAGYKVRIPIPISLTRDYAEYKSTYKLEGNTIVTERYFRLHKREIPPELQQDYIAFKESTDKDQKQTFTLETDNVAPPPIPETAKVNDLIKMAGVAIANKNYQFAEEVLNKALAKESDNKEALHSLASTQNLQRKYDAAIETGNKIITKHKYEVPTYHIIGRSYWSLRKYDDAEKVFLKIIEISPLDIWAHGYLGLVYLEDKKYKEAIPELEQAISLNPEQEFTYQTGLGRAYLNTDQTDKAMEAFESALKLSSEPFVFNNVAYYLSLSGKGLDKAQQYAESAVSETASRLRSAQLNLLNMDTIAKVGALASYWDTLGWVYFQKGDLESAEKYVTAAWNVANHSEVGDHLGQIKEKQGKKDEAAKWYATAAASLHPVHQAGEHLAALIPKDQQTKMLINAKEELETQRHFFIESPLKNEKESKESKESCEAYFFLMLNPDESQRARVTDIKFIKGSEKLRAHGSLLKDLAIPLTFPDKTTTKIIRKGLLWCEPKSDKCKFTLIYHDDVISIN